MSILPTLAINLEISLKRVRKDYFNLKQFVTDPDNEALNLDSKNETLERLQTQITMLEHCYRLAGIAIKNPEFGNMFEDQNQPPIFNFNPEKQ